MSRSKVELRFRKKVNRNGPIPEHRPEPKKNNNLAEILMWEQLTEISRHHTAREWPFAPDRKWRFDFMIEDAFGVDKIAIEIEGGAWTRGRHTRGAGFIRDMEKYNHAALLGWRVLRFTPQQVLDGSAIAFIRKMLDLAA